MERLGFWGIIKLTTHIIFKNLPHFLRIALMIALPYAWSFIVLGPPGEILHNSVASISLLYKISSSQADALDPSEAALIANQQQQQPPLFGLLFTTILSVIISLFSTILVTVSVCRACLNKSVDLSKGSLRGVLRCAKNLVLTVLVMFGVVFMFLLVGMLGMVIIAARLLAVTANVGVPITIIAIGMVGGVVYMAIVFSLVNTVAILEEKKGWEAISKSKHLLIKGSTWIVIGLNGLNGVLIIIMVTLFLTASEEASVVWRWVVQGFIGVCTIASTVVLDTLDTLLAALDSQFGPLDSTPKYLDLETAAYSLLSPQ